MSAISVSWLYVGWGAVTFETTYGLMQQSPLEIKEKLLKALDKEYNVVDMVAVLEIVSILEKTPITKEALETTRLGKYINELRRKTRDDALAKRAKELVRRWRDMILTPAPSPAPPAPSPAPPAPAPAALNGSEPVPRTHASNKRLRKDEQEVSAPAKRPRLNGTVVARSPAPPVPPSPSVPPAAPPTPPAPAAVDPPAPPPAAEAKRRGRKRGSKNRPALSKETGRVDSSADLVKEKIASIARTPRVKTTQELLADLKSRTDGTLPAAGGESQRQDELARSKSELMEKFLRSQQVDGDDDSESKSTRSAVSTPEPPTVAPTPTPPPPTQSVPQETSVDDVLSRLPPLDLDAIDWSEPPSPPPPAPVTPSLVRRLADDRVEGLNGCADHSGLAADGFGEWHQTVSRTTFGDDLLHILPYVVID